MPEVTEEEIESQLEEALPSIEVDATIEKEALDITTSKVYPPLELKPGKSPPAVTGSVDEAEELKDEFEDIYLDAFTKESLEEAGVKVPSKLEKRVENYLEKPYGDEFEITANETDSEVEVVMEVRPEHAEKYAKDRVVFSVVTVGRDWGDISDDLSDYAEIETKNATKVGYLWDLQAISRKSEPFYVDEAARIMKARCEAGAIVGCAIYTRLVKQWIKQALEATDYAAFSPVLDGMRYCGEDRLADELEERFERMPEDMPDAREIKEWQDDFEATMEERVGRSIPASPDETTAAEREKSKEIAIEVGRAKGKYGRSSSERKSGGKKPPRKRKPEKKKESESANYREKIKKRMG